MHAIMEKAGMHTDAQTVLFSLPALFAAGSGAFFCTVRARPSRGEGGVPVSRRFARAAAWLPALLAAAVVQWAVMPGVVRDVCSFLYRLCITEISIYAPNNAYMHHNE